MLAPHQTAFVFITLLATFGDQIEDSTTEQCALVSKPIAQTHTHCEVSNVNWKLAASRHQKAIFRKRAPSFSCFYLASITISGSIRVWIGAQGIATFINIIDPQLRQNDGSCLPANSNLIWFKLTDCNTLAEREREICTIEHFSLLLFAVLFTAVHFWSHFASPTPAVFSLVLLPFPLSHRQAHQ